MKKVSIELTEQQIQDVLGSLVLTYYKFNNIAQDKNEAEKEIWEAIAEGKAELAEIIENQTGVLTFGANSFKKSI